MDRYCCPGPKMRATGAGSTHCVCFARFRPSKVLRWLIPMGLHACLCAYRLEPDRERQGFVFHAAVSGACSQMSGWSRDLPGWLRTVLTMAVTGNRFALGWRLLTSI